MITIQWEYIPLIVLIICIILFFLTSDELGTSPLDLLLGILIVLGIGFYICLGISWLFTHINIV